MLHIQGGSGAIGLRLGLNPGQPAGYVNSPMVMWDSTNMGATRVYWMRQEGDYWRFKVSDTSWGNLVNIMTVDNSGNVGIGTTAPIAKLDVVGIATVRGSGTDRINFEPQGTFHRIAFNELRFWDWDTGGDMVTFNNGNVGIGTTAPAQKLNILVNQTSDYFTLSGCSISANSNVVTCSGGVSGVIPGMFLSIYQASNSYPSGYTPVSRFIVGVNTSLNQLTLDFAVPRSYDSNTFTFQVFKGGALVQNYPSGHTYNMALSGQSIYLSYAGSLAPIYGSIGAVNGTFRIVSQKSVHVFLDAENTFSDSSGEVKFSIGKNSSYFGPTYSEIFYVNESGAVWAASYTCPCDLRLKKDIKPLNSVLDKVLKLNPVYFTWNEKSPYAGKKDIGIIAQEIKKYFPEIVSTDDRGYLGVDYSKLSIVAISAIKEQQKIIEEQAQKIKILEEKIKELESKIEKR
jgi:hypothetical protein